MKHWILIIAVLLFSCRTTMHIQKEKSETHQVKTTDSTANEFTKTVTDEHSDETNERDLDTTIKPEPVKGKAKIPKPRPGKIDTTDVFDSLGNKLGQVASSLDEQSNALNIDYNLQPPDVHAKLHEKGTKKNDKKPPRIIPSRQRFIPRTRQIRKMNRQIRMWSGERLGMD